MTTCSIITVPITFSGDLNRLNKSLFFENSRDFVLRTRRYGDRAIFTASDGGKFTLHGDIQIRKNGKISWRKSRINKLDYKNNSSDKVSLSGLGLAKGIKNILMNDMEGEIVDHLTHFKIRSSEERVLNGGKLNDVVDASNIQSNFRVITGGAGADIITGSDNNEAIAASSKRTLCGYGEGADLNTRVKDVLTGGKGDDTFYVDNGTRIMDIEEGEKIHLYSTWQFDMSNYRDIDPVFKHKKNSTVIKIGDLRIKTNRANYIFTSNLEDACTPLNSNLEVTVCENVCFKPLAPSGFTFTAIEIF